MIKSELDTNIHTESIVSSSISTYSYLGVMHQIQPTCPMHPSPPPPPPPPLRMLPPPQQCYPPPPRNTKSKLSNQGLTTLAKLNLFWFYFLQQISFSLFMLYVIYYTYSLCKLIHEIISIRRNIM